jgi:FkbH-like protein
MPEPDAFESALERGDRLRDTGDAAGAAAAWREAAARVRGPKDVWKVHRRFREMDPAEREGTGVPVRIALIGDSTQDFAAAHLEVALRREGLDPAVYVGPFGQYAREILDDASGLHAFGPDLVIVDVRGETLFPPLYGAGGGDAAPDADAVLEEYAVQVRALAGRGAFVLVHDFVVPEPAPDGIHARWSPDGCVRRVQRLNERLAEELDGIENVAVFDMDAFASRIGKERVRNRKLWHLGKVAVDEPFLGALADEYLRTVKPLAGLNRKVLVLDLDGTLWGGVLGELGPDGIGLATDGPGAPYLEFQREILRLFERGVILAVCSKNNDGDVMPVLRDHPAMALRPEHFAALRIDWNDKVENLRRVAEEINVGVDSLVFLDDNPVERENVRMRLPEVLVPELPDDPVEYAPFLARLPDFDTLRLTSEDRQRGRMYAAEKRRRAERAEAPDLGAYLATLDTVVRVHEARPGEIARVQQLMGKTNQFNTTTLRWDAARIASFRSEEGGRVHVAEVRDRFGDSGLCGVCLSRESGESVEVVDLLLSCRVLGRGVEDAFLRTVLREWADGGARAAEGGVVFTPKNPPVRSLFEGNGFRKTEEDEAGTRWQAELGAVSLDPPEWIRVETDTGKEAGTA